jgi:hypothetical protein
MPWHMETDAGLCTLRCDVVPEKPNLDARTQWCFSRGTAANGCCCTVMDVGTTVSPAASHPTLATLIPTCTVYGETLYLMMRRL